MDDVFGFLEIYLRLIGVGFIISLVFAALKIAGVNEIVIIHDIATWSWLRIFAPFWVLIFAGAIILSVLSLAAFIQDHLNKHKNR